MTICTFSRNDTLALFRGTHQHPFVGTIRKINGDGAIVELMSKADHSGIEKALISLDEAKNIKLETFPFQKK